jgi:hypothetical protein
MDSRAQQQQQQAAATYMRAQPTSPMATYDEYRRNSSSSSSYGYPDRNREWAYSSPGSRHGEMTWSATSATHSHPHAPPSHHPHHHHSSRQHQADSGGSGSSNGRHPSSSPTSEQSSPPQTQSQYGYMTGTHANSRYRPGY